jgi:hypothetical protein
VVVINGRWVRPRRVLLCQKAYHFEIDNIPTRNKLLNLEIDNSMIRHVLLHL